LLDLINEGWFQFGDDNVQRIVNAAVLGGTIGDAIRRFHERLVSEVINEVAHRGNAAGSGGMTAASKVIGWAALIGERPSAVEVRVRINAARKKY
jgi:hypothetical protein